MEIRQSGSEWSIYRIIRYYPVGDGYLKDVTKGHDDFITVASTIQIAELAVMYFYLGRGESRHAAKWMAKCDSDKAIAKKYDN